MFGLIFIVFDEYDLGYLVYELNIEVVKFVCVVCDKYLIFEWFRFVVGVIGFIIKIFFVIGGIIFFELVELYEE